jgi:hypothetical protein
VRVVFDTNVLYSALAAKGFSEEVVDEAVAECDIVRSDRLKRDSNHSSRAGIRLVRPPALRWRRMSTFANLSSRSRRMNASAGTKTMM